MRPIYLLLFLSISILANGQNILDEDFNKNKWGWTEGEQDHYKASIQDGSYYIQSKDKKLTKSSVGAKNTSFLWTLPDHYIIKTAITLADKGKQPSSFGLTLWGNTLEYRFEISSSGWVEIQEYDLHRKKGMLLGRGQIALDTDKTIQLEIEVNGPKISCTANEELIGHGILKTKGWADMRLFVSNEAVVEVDYIRIKKQ